MARKAGSTSSRERCLQRSTASIHTQTSSRQTHQKEQEVEGLQVPLLREDTSLPSAPLLPRVNAIHGPSSRVKCFLWKHGIFLNFDADVEDSWEGVGELQDAGSRDHGSDSCEFRDSSTDDEGDGPVDGNHADPEHLASLGGEWWTLEQILDDVLVDDFDANVAVQDCSDDTGDKIDDVRDCLPGVNGKTLVGRVVDELSLLRVEDKSEHEVADVDEDLGAELGLDEIKWATHFSHEFTVKHSTTISIDDLHDGVHLRVEGRPCWNPNSMNDWAFRNAETGQYNVIIGSRMCCNANGHEDPSNIEPDSKVGKPSKFCESSNLANNGTTDRPEDDTNHKAKLEFGDLGERLTVHDDDDSDVTDKLNGLEDVHAVTGSSAKNAEAHVTECSHGVFVRVELHEHTPDHPASIECHYTHEGVGHGSTNITKLGYGPGRIGRAKDIGCDEVDN